MALLLQNLTDFIGSLSIIVVLSVAYGAVHRQIASGHTAQIILGLMFGLASFLEMHNPLSAWDGVLIDMRNVPVALAGAFLGRWGLGSCLILAICGRMYAGGTGATSGILAMLIAAGMGRLWHHLTIAYARRGLLMMLGLGVMMSLHILAATILPVQAFLWFYREAAIPIVTLNMLVVPLTAWIIERERRMILYESKLRDAGTTDPDTGFLTWGCFARDLGLQMAAAPPGQIAGLAVIRVQHQPWLIRQWGERLSNMMLGGLLLRVNKVLGETPLIGLTTDHRIVVPLTAIEMQRRSALVDDLEHAIAGEGFNLPGGLLLRVGVNVSVRRVSSYKEMEVLLTQLGADPATRTKPSLSKKPARKQRGHWRISRKRHPEPDPPTHLTAAKRDVLFDKAALLMSTR
ncbi:LytS/YhcK type 5TM receptor domain-containing protein [Aestuariivita sp.]|jgi:hypothetical protein|uniref:LytS/YhcK type 5TM receptor domain-containing protein n=1 Tax=Aestuariivita sp. TaxID=1872407 RepID=UPI0021743541|nr:LytS/YhcK type 5TM receptor domain-containing protein [Aestuariivita sp.]MCE8006516.1 hypothetical protein [Aestuariivita sp.]